MSLNTTEVTNICSRCHSQMGEKARICGLVSVLQKIDRIVEENQTNRCRKVFLFMSSGTAPSRFASLLEQRYQEIYAELNAREYWLLVHLKVLDGNSRKQLLCQLELNHGLVHLGFQRLVAR
jgi:hypothetical protein